jgi:copper chaperone CopZ
MEERHGERNLASSGCNLRALRACDQAGPEPYRGVRQVDVNIPGKEVRVSYDEAIVDLERIKTILQDEDYPVASATRA